MPDEWVSRLLVSPTSPSHKGTVPAPLPLPAAIARCHYPLPLPAFGQSIVLEREQALPLGVDPPVAPWPGELGPAQGADLIEVGQAGVPVVKQHAPRGKAPLLGSAQQGLHMVVLAQRVRGLVIEALVDRHQ